MKDKEMILAIDGNAIVHRAFHAYPASLTTSTGIQDNAVYGFTTMLLQALKQFNPKYVICTFDTGKKTFRHTQFSDYKAHRKPTDESLNAQFPLVKEILKAFNIPYIEKDGFEADDLLGTIASWVQSGKWSNGGNELYIITGDRDLLQLIDSNVHICLPSGSFSNLIVYDRETVAEKFGYYPEQVTDYKAIVGDASDNIPGVKGVGDKTALELLVKYQTLDNLYKHINEIPSRYQTKLAEGVEQAYFSKELATIKRDVEFELKLEDCLLLDFDEQELLDVFRKFEFRSLINKIPKSINSKEETPQLDLFGGSISNNAQSVVKEIESLEAIKGAIRVAFYEIPDNYMLVSYVDNSGEVFVNKISVDNLLKSTEDISEGCETYFYGWENFVSHPKTEVVEWFERTKCVDMQLLVFTSSSGRKDFSLEGVLFDYLSFKSSSNDYWRIGEALVNLVPALMNKVEDIKDTEYVVAMKKKVSKSLGYNVVTMTDAVRYIEMPISKILARMENRGVMVDRKVLEELKLELKDGINDLVKDIYADIGHEVNLNSPKQLSEVIYNELNIPDSLGGRRSRSTREEVLLQMKDVHPAISKILKYRELSKVLNTYVLPYLEVLNTTGVDQINTDFKQTGASSGRFASINPNMQNIPIRSEWGDKIRRVFVPRDGFIMMGADYSQIEFRVMADISQDKVLMDDFMQGRDIHRATAARILKKDESEVTNAERSFGKTINFAILFGQTQFGLSSMMNIDRNDAQKYIDEYFETYKGVKKYIDNATKEALDNGYVQSMIGRTRFVAGLTSRNFNVRNAAIREAVNMPIQGGEADIMKIAMIKIKSLIKEKYLGEAYMLLQIHDEIIFEVKKERAEEFSEDVRDLMVNAIQLSIPLDVHISLGESMNQLK
ncbi:MAG TPA: DNA polymerase I [Candidatus Dojkabacteria bacterium]|nr:DNA polymerase I [Candidatus Dojkabacteria bacterium]